jgi:hypothetical protein
MASALCWQQQLCRLCCVALHMPHRQPCAAPKTKHVLSTGVAALLLNCEARCAPLKFWLREILSLCCRDCTALLEVVGRATAQCSTAVLHCAAEYLH